MTSKEFKITKCWPRTLRYIMSPVILAIDTDCERFTVGLTPFIINDPRFLGRHIEKVSN